MPDLKSVANVYLVLALIVPGLIITWTRAQCITGRLKSLQESAVAYLALSVLYYGLAFPIVEYVLTYEAPGWPKALAWLGLVFVGPLCIGLALGVCSQRGWFRSIAHRFGINPVHSTPTSWDAVFSDRRGSSFVMVTLADGSTVSGIFGSDSFASSDPAERDLLIEEIWDVNDEGQWSRRPQPASIYIPPKEIKHVQFWAREECYK